MFHLGSYEYPSKEALKARLKSYLDSAPDGPVTNAVAIEKLQYLLLLHPRAIEKIGAGVASFVIARNERGSGKGFKLIRVDGTEERFSYKACLDGQTPTDRSRAVEALRFAVRPQLMVFRRSLALPVACALTGEMIADHADLHVDHSKPFWLLVREFCLREGVNLAALKTVGNGEQLTLQDEEMVCRFQRFHEKHARLQPTRKRANLEKGGDYDVPSSLTSCQSTSGGG
ncbi:DUF3223 domain-containing protein [Burkholderia pseudomallei]